MKKVYRLCPILAVAFLLCGCLSTGGGNRGMLSNINALAYPDDDVNVDFASKIWNGPVNVVSDVPTGEYLASYNLDYPEELTLYIPFSQPGGGAEYAAEAATILSYFAELYRQVHASEAISVSAALSHMKESYALVLDKYLRTGGKTPMNPRHFSELVNGLSNCDVQGSVYYLNGSATITDGIVVEYTL